MNRNGMSCSAAGRLGAIKTKAIMEEFKRQRMESYSKNPNRCVNCGNIIAYEHRFNVFCSQSCAASFNNRKRPKRKHTCIGCGKEIVKSSSKYCSLTCFGLARWKQLKEQIRLTGKFPAFTTTNETSRRVVRRYLEEINGHRCAICGRTEWNGKPILLIVDHIDGNSTNHDVTNFRLICPNCDSTTETYKFKHARTSTRTWRDKYKQQNRRNKTSEQD